MLALYSKGNRLEVHDIEEGLLHLKMTIPVYGKVAILKPFKPNVPNFNFLRIFPTFFILKGSRGHGDLLFVSTEKYKFCIIRYDSKLGEIESLAMGDMLDNACRPIDVGQLCCIDPYGRLIILHLFQGLLKVIPVESPRENSQYKFKNAFNMRLQDLQVCSIDMLTTGPKDPPSIVLIHQTVGYGKAIKTYHIGIDKSLQTGPFEFDVDETSHTVISVPAPRGGILIIAEESIQYYNHEYQINTGVTMSRRKITSHALVDDDGFRFILGDIKGSFIILILFMNKAEGKVDNIKLEHLGTTSISTCLAYLDEGKVFVGSLLGNSQIIQLSSSRQSDGTFLKILSEGDSALESNAPIVDFQIADLDTTGQHAIVACTGGFKEGKVSVIRRGVGANLSFDFEFNDQMTGVWPLALPSGCIRIEHLVISDQSTSHLLHLDFTKNSVEILENQIILSSNPSILVGQYGSMVFQVSPSSINYSCYQAKSSRKIWIPQGNATILAADFAEDRLVVTISNGYIIVFKVSKDGILQLDAISLGSVASCVAIDRLQNSGPLVALFGVWEPFSLHYVNLDETDRLLHKLIDLPLVCRSIKVAHFDGSPYVFAGLANGSITYGPFIDMKLSNIRTAVVGQRPVSLSFLAKNLIIALSDRPTLITSLHGRPHFLSVGLQETIAMAGANFNTSPYGFVTLSNGLVNLGHLDIQKTSKLHTDCPVFGETTRKIVHLKEEGLFAVLTIKPSPDSTENFSPNDLSSIILIDEANFEIVHRFSLPEFEMVQSIVKVQLPSKERLIVVGSAVLDASNEADEAKKGRLVTFRIGTQRQASSGFSGRKDYHLEQVSSQEVPGTVYSLAWAKDRLIASVNGQICLFQYYQDRQFKDEGSPAPCWKLLHSHYGQIIGIHIEAHENDDLISIGDMMRSANVLKIESETRDKIAEVARDYHTGWVSCVKFVDADHLLVSDDHGNLCQLVKGADSNFVTERLILEHTSGFHVGSAINAIQQGGLGEQGHNTEDHVISKPFIFGTATGGLGLVGVIRDKRTYEILKCLQANILVVSNTIGFFDHTQWRSFCNDKRSFSDHSFFVDGDVIQRFWLLSEALRQKVVDGDASLGCLKLPHSANLAFVIDLLDELGSH